MNFLTLTSNEELFLTQNNGELDYKRNVIIIPASKWDNIQKELAELENKKRDNEDDFNLKEQDYYNSLFLLNGQTVNEEKQYTEKLTQIQNEILSYHRKIKANSLEALERKGQQIEQKIQNEMTNNNYFEEQKTISNNLNQRLSKDIEAFRQEDVACRQRLENCEVEIEQIKQKKIEEMNQERLRAQNRNMNQNEDDYENKTKQLKKIIDSAACIACKVNRAMIFMEKCQHLCYCKECLRSKSKNDILNNNPKHNAYANIECLVCHKVSSIIRPVFV